MGKKSSQQDKQLRRQVSAILLVYGLSVLVAAPLIFLLLERFNVDALVSLSIALGAAFVITIAGIYIIERLVTKPYVMIEQALEHLDPADRKSTAPDIEKLAFAKDHTRETIKKIYELVERAGAAAPKGGLNIAVLRGSLMDKFNFPIVALDGEGRIVYANNNCLALIGRKDLSEISGKDIDLVLPLSIRNKPVLKPWLETCRSDKITAATSWSDIRYSTPQHQPYSFDVHAQYMRDDPAGADVILMLIDRTSEREFEDMKVDFVALAAHELRAPITVIRGYMEVFEEEVGPSLGDDHRQFLSRMKVSGAQLAGFINNILDASRVDQGRLNLHFSEGDWAQTLKSAVEDMSLQAEAMGRKIEVRIAPDLPRVMIDPVSIVEVINNLIDNAIKYSPTGGVINVTAGVGQNGGIQTDVTDHGIGIPANLLEKLFTKFYRSHRSRQQFSGTGLGLYLSKAIIESHHGNIWANSKEGEGSTFSFWLPAAGSVAMEPDRGNNKLEGITRGAHGWIKNHSMFRR